MVAISPSTSLSARPHRVMRRSVTAAAVLCWAAVVALGCQQNTRFAGGADAAPTPYRASAPVAASPTLETAPAPVLTAPPASPGVGRLPLAWSPNAASRPWRWIVIHHSATDDGGATRFDKEHRVNGWDELGYHFVIGNGSDTGNGQIEVGPRWRKQKHGAHAKTPDNRFNDFGIGICLVGNFESARPSEKQMRSLATLVAHLMKRYDIPANRVIGHDDTGRSTACPGHNLEIQLAAIRRAAAQAVAAGSPAPHEVAGRTALYAVDRR